MLCGSDGIFRFFSSMRKTNVNGCLFFALLFLQWCTVAIHRSWWHPIPKKIKSIFFVWSMPDHWLLLPFLTKLGSVDRDTVNQSRLKTLLDTSWVSSETKNSFIKLVCNGFNRSDFKFWNSKINVAHDENSSRMFQNFLVTKKNFDWKKL